ncbi:MAG: hypothetical protein V4717_18910 [Bacteroidota bacterium]
MTKNITKYSLSLLASANDGVQAQILFSNETAFFVGRIDFYKGTELPKSYLWHPTNANDESQTYLVLAMSHSVLGNVADLLRNEGPWILELSPSTPPPFFGASTQGYGGKLKTVGTEKTGEGDFNFSLLL